jgi:hypothetical protein
VEISFYISGYSVQVTLRLQDHFSNSYPEHSSIFERMVESLKILASYIEYYPLDLSLACHSVNPCAHTAMILAGIIRECLNI